MPETPREAFAGLNAVEEAEARAYRRGAKAAELEAKLTTHFAEDDRRFGELQKGQERIETKVYELGGKINKVSDKIEQKDAAQKAVTEATKEAAERGLTTRTFVIGLVAAIGSLAGLLALVGAHF